MMCRQLPTQKCFNGLTSQAFHRLWLGAWSKKGLVRLVIFAMDFSNNYSIHPKIGLIQTFIMKKKNIPSSEG